MTEHPVTLSGVASSHGFRLHGIRGRFEELTLRGLLAESAARLKASGRYDPAVHGKRDEEPLTAAEHLEVLALGEGLARHYRHPSRVDQAVRAGASWAQIAEAVGAEEATVRQGYRDWAAGQHDMWASTGCWAGEEPRRFGMNDADYTEALSRAAVTEAYPNGIGNPDSIGIQAGGRAAGDREAGQ